MFNALKIDPIGQAEAWRMVASKFNRVPGFIYTKTKSSKNNYPRVGGVSVLCPGALSEKPQLNIVMTAMRVIQSG